MKVIIAASALARPEVLDIAFTPGEAIQALGPYPILQFFAALIVLVVLAVGGMAWLRGEKKGKAALESGLDAPRHPEAAVQLFFDGPLRAIFDSLSKVEHALALSKLENKDSVAEMLSATRRRRDPVAGRGGERHGDQQARHGRRHQRAGHRGSRAARHCRAHRRDHDASATSAELGGGGRTPVSQPSVSVVGAPAPVTRLKRNLLPRWSYSGAGRHYTSQSRLGSAVTMAARSSFLRRLLILRWSSVPEAARSRYVAVPAASSSPSR
jgi:hypothetical protein